MMDERRNCSKVKLIIPEKTKQIICENRDDNTKEKFYIGDQKNENLGFKPKRNYIKLQQTKSENN